MKRNILMLLLLTMFLNLSFSNYCYAKKKKANKTTAQVEKEEKKQARREKVVAKQEEAKKKVGEAAAKVKKFFQEIVPTLKKRLEEVDYDTTEELEVVVPLKFTIKGKEVDLSVGFKWMFAEPGAGPDFLKGFDTMKAELTSPSLNSLDFGFTIPGIIGDIGLLNALLGIGVPKNIQKAVADIAKLIKQDLKVDIEPVLNLLRNMAIVKGDTLFLIKTIMLFNSYIKQERVKEIPVQMGLLFVRLINTIDLEATIAANGGQANPKNWTQRVYFKGPSEFINRLSKPLRDILNDIKPEINEETYQEWQDRKDGPSDFQIAYSVVREQRNYDRRIVLTEREILPLIAQNLNFTDRGLLVYLLQRLVFERKYARRDATIPRLKVILQKSLKALRDMDAGDKPFLRAYHQKRIVEINNLIAKADKPLPKANLASIEEAEIDEDGNPVEELIVRKGGDLGPELAESTAKYRRKIPLPQYLDYLYYKFTSPVLMNKRFYGDVGYLFDDAVLGYDRSAVYLMAILLRSAKDLDVGVKECLKKVGGEAPKYLRYKNRRNPARAIYFTKLVGQPAKINPSKLEIETPGTLAQGKRDEAWVALKRAELAYRFLPKKSDKDAIALKKNARNKALKAYAKAEKDLFVAKAEFKKLVFNQFRFRRGAPFLREKTIRKRLMDKLELLTDDRSGNEVSTTDLVKKMKILVANPKYDVDQAFLREINVLSEETVQAFLIREIAKLLQRTRHFDAIRVIVEPYLMILGITFEDLMLYIEQGEADLEEYLEEEFAEEDLEFDYGEGVEAFDETEMEDFDEEEMDEEEEEDVSSKLKQPIQTPIGIEVEEIEVASTVPVA